VHEISFYTDELGKSPVEEFLDELRTKDAQKVVWVLQLIEQHDIIPKTYFKKLVNTDDIWEVRAQSGKNIYRLLCFVEGQNVIVLTNGFQKKTQKTPKKEIILAEKRKIDWLGRNKNE
jgi:phage-related protein